MAKAAGSRGASWAVVGVLAAAVALQPLACTQTGEDPTDPTTLAALADVGPQVVQPALAAALGDAVALQTAAESLAAAPDDEQRWLDTRDAWRQAMTTWQTAELMQIGPLGSSLHAQGGADGRDTIYSWPTTNPCRVDQETAAGAFDQDGWSDTALVNVRGLDAVEHLLWSGPDNSCPGQVDINADGTWDALGDAEIQRRRAAYVDVLAAQLVQDLEAQRAAWQAFEPSLAAPGSDDSAYSSASSALNAIYDALFYLETRTKDLKLAVPLGLRDCDAEACPEAVEAQMSGVSTEAIAANLEGFAALFEGGEGTGLADVLSDRGHGDLVASIRADLDAALDAVDRIDQPLDVQLATDRAPVDALHDAIKALTDHLKGDVATVLSLSLPTEAAGDID